MRLICRFLRSTASPHYFFPSLSPTPQLLEATTRFVTPESLTAWIKFIGTPLMPKPPTNRKEPLVIPSIASLGELQILLKKCHLRVRIVENMTFVEELIISNFIVSTSKATQLKFYLCELINKLHWQIKHLNVSNKKGSFLLQIFFIFVCSNYYSISSTIWHNDWLKRLGLHLLVMITLIVQYT